MRVSSVAIPLFLFTFMLAACHPIDRCETAISEVFGRCDAPLWDPISCSNEFERLQAWGCDTEAWGRYWTCFGRNATCGVVPSVQEGRCPELAQVCLQDCREP